jgi:hypothetical protein
MFSEKSNVGLKLLIVKGRGLLAIFPGEAGVSNVL